MLSETWLGKHQESRLRNNFFRDLSRILLSISRIPLPRIGFFIIDNNGYLSLTNRPLRFELQNLENEKIPTDIPRDCTYSTVDSYVVDLLGVHDNRLRYQPNAVNDVTDCACQMAAHAAMRTIFPLFFQQELRRGPFVMSLTNLHQSNIFVDDDWHITCLVDLEWACSRPIEMVQPPHWLTNKAADVIVPEEFDAVRTELMAILTAEETQRYDRPEFSDSTMPHLSNVMNNAWETGAFWYTLALFSPTGLFKLFFDRIRPKFDEGDSDDFPRVMPFFWDKDAGEFVACKLATRKKYDHELQLAFQ
ncbi:hypothetical protein VTN31DRAFT_6654 [Thermomyces dupontii]|uniref:uncharacterized protein n=1 Tax=Talaromyces thermophilus TaxID=28565 RepID=UPI003741F5B8